MTAIELKTLFKQTRQVIEPGENTENWAIRVHRAIPTNSWRSPIPLFVVPGVMTKRWNCNDRLGICTISCEETQMKAYKDFVIVSAILLILGVAGIIGYSVGRSHEDVVKAVSEEKAVQTAPADPEIGITQSQLTPIEFQPGKWGFTVLQKTENIPDFEAICKPVFNRFFSEHPDLQLDPASTGYSKRAVSNGIAFNAFFGVKPAARVREATNRKELTKNYWAAVCLKTIDLHTVVSQGASDKQVCQATRQMSLAIQDIPAAGVDEELVQCALTFARTWMAVADADDPDKRAAQFFQSLGEMAATGNQGVGWRNKAEQDRIHSAGISAARQMREMGSTLSARYGEQFKPFPMTGDTSS